MIIALRSCWLDTGGDDSVTGSARPVSSVSGGAPSGSGSRWTEPSGSRLSPVTQRFLEPEAAGGQALGEDELARRRRELIDV